MSAGAANRRKGSAYETGLVAYFRDEDFDTERQRLSGTEDEGDLALRVGGGSKAPRVIVEAKSGKNIRPRFWYEEEAVPEAANYAKKRKLKCRTIPALMMKTHNKAIGKSLVTISLDDFTYLLQRGESNG